MPLRTALDIGGGSTKSKIASIVFYLCKEKK